MNISTRKATIDDIAYLVDFNRGLARETEDIELPRETVASGVRAALADPERKGWYLLAECDGEVAGGLLVTREWSDWRDGFFWWIQSVYVLKRFRGRGVYTALHRSLEMLARRSDDVVGIRLYVDQANDRAKRQYERLGMHPARYHLYEVDVPARDG